MDDALINSDDFYQRLLRKDHKAFNDLYDHFSAALYREILKSVQDQVVAEDIFQDTFLKIYKQLQQFNPSKGRLFTWMITIAKNSCLDYFSGPSFKHAEYHQVSDNLRATDQNDIPNKIQFHIIQQLPSLSETTKALLKLIYVHGYTYEETARMCGIPVGTLKTRMRATLKELQKTFAAPSIAS